MSENIISTPDEFFFLLEEFQKESDRAAVILAVSLIDEQLLRMLKSYLVPIPNAKDELFEGANAPIGTFSSKISIAHRIGLISSQLCRDIHLLRKIRNSFAHDIYDCNFENKRIKSIITELNKSLTYVDCEGFVSGNKKFLEKRKIVIEQGLRGDFLVLVSYILITINNRIKEVNVTNGADKEFIYGPLKTDWK